MASIKKNTVSKWQCFFYVNKYLLDCPLKFISIKKLIQYKKLDIERQTKANQLRGAGVTQAGIAGDLDQFEEPTAEPGSPSPEAPGGGTPGSTPGGGGAIPGGQQGGTPA